MNLHDLMDMVAQAEDWASQNGLDPSEVSVRMGTQVDTWPLQFDVREMIAHEGTLYLIEDGHPRDGSPYLDAAVLEEGEIM